MFVIKEISEGTHWCITLPPELTVCCPDLSSDPQWLACDSRVLGCAVGTHTMHTRCVSASLGRCCRSTVDNITQPGINLCTSLFPLNGRQLFLGFTLFRVLDSEIQCNALLSLFTLVYESFSAT